MDGPPPTWAAELLVAFRRGHLSADELWCVVLDCHALIDPAPVVDLVLRSHAAWLTAPAASAPTAPPTLPTFAPTLSDPPNEAELFVLDETSDGLSIPA